MGKVARREESESRSLRRSANSGGRSLTTNIPSESGPKASSRLAKGTVPAFRSRKETVTGSAVLIDDMLGENVVRWSLDENHSNRHEHGHLQEDDATVS